jgi:hypothetical protein
MQMAVGGIDGDEADLLRRAMGSKRGVEKISSLKDKLYAGMVSNGITGDLADEIYSKIEAFANFGFAESHSISFALLVYSSTWFRLHYPAAFPAALLPRVALPVHYEGWAHFKDGRAAVEQALSTASEDIRGRVRHVVGSGHVVVESRGVRPQTGSRNGRQMHHGVDAVVPVVNARQGLVRLPEVCQVDPGRGDAVPRGRRLIQGDNVPPRIVQVVDHSPPELPAATGDGCTWHPRFLLALAGEADPTASQMITRPAGPIPAVYEVWDGERRHSPSRADQYENCWSCVPSGL